MESNQSCVQKTSNQCIKIELVQKSKECSGKYLVFERLPSLYSFVFFLSNQEKDPFYNHDQKYEDYGKYVLS